MSPTTVTGARTGTTFGSIAKTSLVAAHIALTSSSVTITPDRSWEICFAGKIGNLVGK
jgi:hypothetical protein